MGDGLIGVIVGGIIAIISGIATPMVQHFLGKKDREEEARKANVQSIVLAIYELDDWLDRYKQKVAFGEKIEIGVSPQAVVEALVLIHFPQAKLELRELNAAIAEIKSWATSRQSERVANKTMNMENFSEICGHLAAAKSNIVAAVTGETRLLYNPETEGYEPVVR